MRRFATILGVVPMLVSCADGRERSAPLALEQPLFTATTSKVCMVLGIGSRKGDGPTGDPAYLPHNFPGVSATWIHWTSLGAHPPAPNTTWAPSPPYVLPALIQPVLCEAAGCFSAVSPGKYHPAGFSPVILGTDWSHSFEYRGSDGQTRTVFTYGDTDAAPWVGRDPNNAYVTWNDDAMGFTTQTATPGSSATFPCIDINFYARPEDGTQIDPATLDGLHASGGYWTGILGIPGPGFAVRNAAKGYDEAFAVFQDLPLGANLWTGYITCNTDSDCRAAGAGGPTDRCIYDPRVLTRACKYGPGLTDNPPCNAGANMCFTRIDRGRLGNSPEGTNAFVRPQPGVKVASATVEQAYTNKFSVRSFARNPSDDAEVYVLGRESWFGTSNYRMHPYLMRQKYVPASGGLQAALYWKGTCGGGACTDTSNNPDFVADPSQAVKIYNETKDVIWTTSFRYLQALADLDGKGWVVMYGGRVPSAVRKHPYFKLIGPTNSFAPGATYPPDLSWDTTSYPLGVYMRRAARPWSSWTDPVEVFNPSKPAVYEGFCESFYWDQSNVYDQRPAGFTGFTGCSAAQLPHNTSLYRYKERGSAGEYSPDIIERFTRPISGGVELYWTISVWHPYQVMLQRTIVRP